jgi:GNAT superfamily N-acetyltransferase
MLRSTCDDPPSTIARAVEARATAVATATLERDDPEARDTLDAWLDAITVLERRALTPPTRIRLEDARRISTELGRVLAGSEPGEGRAPERTLHVALARGRVHAMSSMFACPGGTFIELLVTAPWNILGPEDPADPRTVRGAGSALITEAVAWSRRRGCGGRVALQAENARALALYERLGFHRMGPADVPLSLVPQGVAGWRDSILRVAAGECGAEEARSPWLVYDPLPGRRAESAVRRPKAG